MNLATNHFFFSFNATMIFIWFTKLVLKINHIIISIHHLIIIKENHHCDENVCIKLGNIVYWSIILYYMEYLDKCWSIEKLWSMKWSVYTYSYEQFEVLWLENISPTCFSVKSIDVHTILFMIQAVWKCIDSLISWMISLKFYVRLWITILAYLLLNV